MGNQKFRWVCFLNGHDWRIETEINAHPFMPNKWVLRCADCGKTERY